MNDFELLNIGRSLLDDYRQWLSTCAGSQIGTTADTGVQLQKMQKVLENPGMAGENDPEQQLAHFFSTGFVPDDLHPTRPFSTEPPYSEKDTRTLKKTSWEDIQHSNSPAPEKRLMEAGLSENPFPENNSNDDNIAAQPARTQELTPEYRDNPLAAASEAPFNENQILGSQARAGVKPSASPEQHAERMRDTLSKSEHIPPVFSPRTGNTLNIPGMEKPSAPETAPETTFSTVKGMKDFASLVSPPALRSASGWQQQVVESPVQIAKTEPPRLEKRADDEAGQSGQTPVQINHNLVQYALPETLPPDSILQAAPERPDTDELMEIFSERITRAFYRFYG